MKKWLFLLFLIVLLFVLSFLLMPQKVDVNVTDANGLVKICARGRVSIKVDTMKILLDNNCFEGETDYVLIPKKIRKLYTDYNFDILKSGYLVYAGAGS